MNNLPVTFSTASSGLTLTPGESNTNESGIAQATLAGVAFGEQTVTASLANTGASDNKTVHFIGDTAAAKIIELTPVPDSIFAGTPQNSTGSVITATVVDNNGFPVKGVTVNFTSRTNSAEMTNGGQAVTNEQGKATVTYTNTRSSIESGARPDTVEASLEMVAPRLAHQLMSMLMRLRHISLCYMHFLIQSPQARQPVCILR